MGIVRLPSIKDNWSTEFRVEQLSSKMTRDRFLEIRSHLHFVDNITYTEGCIDKFFKVRPIMDYVLEACTTHLDEKKIYCIDETMIPYKGTRAGKLRQYIQSKPIKWGFKFFQISGSDGIIYSFIPYQGSSTFTSLNGTLMALTQKEIELGVGASAVIALCKSIQNNCGMEIYCDNYFSSLKLFLYLRDEFGIFATGTFRSNRIENCLLIPDKLLKKEGRGSTDHRTYKNKFILIKYSDNKCVIVGSTKYGLESKSNLVRWCNEKRKKNIPCPNTVKKYNEIYGGRQQEQCSYESL